MMSDGYSNGLTDSAASACPYWLVSMVQSWIGRLSNGSTPYTNGARYFTIGKAHRAFGNHGAYVHTIDDIGRWPMGLDVECVGHRTMGLVVGMMKWIARTPEWSSEAFAVSVPVDCSLAIIFFRRIHSIVVTSRAGDTRSASRYVPAKSSMEKSAIDDHIASQAGQVHSFNFTRPYLCIDGTGGSSRANGSSSLRASPWRASKVPTWVALKACRSGLSEPPSRNRCCSPLLFLSSFLAGYPL